MNLKKVERKGVEWINLVSDRNKWRAVANAVMNVRGSIECWEFFWLAEELLASPEQLCFLELVILLVN